ncbi:uncharacterized protein zf(c2h2)-117 isoform X2 [Ciona intestinalis]
MDEFSQNMVVLKRDEKDMLLTNKDPHLSHLFDHSGPRTPNSVSTNPSQSAMEVEGSFTEANNDDYQLFEEQGGSYMPEFSPDSSNLIIDTGSREGYNNNNCTQRDSAIATSKAKDFSLHCKTETNNGNPYSVSDVPTSVYVRENKGFVVGLSKRDLNRASHKTSQSGASNLTSKQLRSASPPPDHYNMQLLAHSAQQQQQLLQKQKKKEATFRHGSSNALQQLALKASLRQDHSDDHAPDSTFKSESVFSYPFSANQVSTARTTQTLPFIKTTPQSYTVQQSSTRQINNTIPIPNPYGGWSFIDSSKEVKHASDISFAHQDSPVFILQQNEGARSTPKLEFLGLQEERKPPMITLPPKTSIEPELKSPLDHPEHQLDNQQRSRFFSTESVTGSVGETALDDEAPINDRDKQAAAALRVLLEQSEKTTPDDHVRSRIFSKRMTQIKQEDRNTRTTPPPAYDHSLQGEQLIQQYVQFQPNSEPMCQPSSNVNPAYQHCIPTEGSVKQEPISPMTTFCPSAINFSNSKNIQKHPNTSDAMYQQMIETEILDSRNPILPQCTEPNTFVSNPNESGNFTPNRPVMLETTLHTPISSPVKQVVPGKPRRSSSSGSSGHRNSDGSLTCTLCGHSFRSTPALNGHMRVHSSNDKKAKEVASSRAEFTLKPNIPSSIAKLPQTEYIFPNNPPLNGGSLHYSTNTNVIQSPFVLSSVGSKVDNQPHNGLLTMATAASLLKTDPARSEYNMYQPQALPQAYVMQSGMLLQQPTMVNMLDQGFNEVQNFKTDNVQVGVAQNVPYNPLYPTQTLPLRNLNLPVSNPTQHGLIPPDMLLGNPQINQDRETLTPQTYVVEQPQKLVSDMPFPAQYNAQGLMGTNSLSQLASIAVATANRDQLQDFGMQHEIQGHFIPNEMHNSVNDSIPSNSDEWIATGQPNQPQQPQALYDDSPVTQETSSPIRSGHDPFILPVTVPVHHKPQDYNQYESSIEEPVSYNRVTWCDRPISISTSPFSSYDDPLMREAVNVANPSKILPNSMMGGTPTGSMFGSTSRPFRQRHHSEGSHLIKASNESILKQMLHSPVPAVKLRLNKPAEKDSCQSNRLVDTDAKSQASIAGNAVNVTATHNAKENKTTVEKPAAKTREAEIWAEPKPVQQRRVRRRRHSADCRLLKSSSYLYHPKHEVVRPTHQGLSPIRKPSVMRSDSRVRHKPPPLIIPSSVNTFTPLSGAHSHFYQSHLRHRRRTSGDSNSSYNGGNDKIPPYTPPPMLSPIRAGSGLYCTTPVTPSVKFLRQMSLETIPPIIEEDESLEMDDECIRSTEPKINIGPRFQANLPNRENPSNKLKLKHKADRIWNRVANNEQVETHLENLMELSCSAVVLHGGANKEYAMHCMSKNKGDILSTVKCLLRVKGKPPPAPIGPGKHTGTPWTPHEVKMFDCGMLEHRKDFYVISKMVKTRSTSECVDRYYHIVKRNRRKIQRPRRYRGEDGDEKMIVTRLATSNHHEMKEILSASASSSEDERCGNNASQDLPWQIPVTMQQQHNVQSRLNIGSNTSMKAIRANTVRSYPKIDSPSPAASPASVASSDDPPPQIFSCPVCGKSFAKVKSRNAHMKTHGKHAQEKRRLREEEARKRSEALQQHPPSRSTTAFNLPSFKAPTVTNPPMLPPPHPSGMNHPYPRFGGNI